MTSSSERKKMVGEIFPDGIPVLWCPALTHYKIDGAIDKQRMRAHIATMAPRVKSYLVPGSTGDGWEMEEDEVRDLLSLMVELASDYNLKILVGILKTDTGAACQTIMDTMQWLAKLTGGKNNRECLAKSGICGFAVCPPKGAAVAQEAIRQKLCSILELGLPTALYQLPQITENEMFPETVAYAAAHYSNFYLFKDSSGNDKVALSGLDVGGVFLVRGAEGDYTRWLRCSRGPYDGFLLSTANCFAKQLCDILSLISSGGLKEAESISDTISQAVKEVFDCVAGIPAGNAFTNANKAMDHFFAFGKNAADVPAPRLHAGISIPDTTIRAVGAILLKHDLLPDKGYLTKGLIK